MNALTGDRVLIHRNKLVPRHALASQATELYHFLIVSDAIWTIGVTGCALIRGKAGILRQDHSEVQYWIRRESVTSKRVA